jgi:hypothetical protein
MICYHGVIYSVSFCQIDILDSYLNLTMVYSIKTALLRATHLLYPYLCIFLGLYLWSTLSIEEAVSQHRGTYLHIVWNYYIPFTACSSMLISIGCRGLVQNRFLVCKRVLTTVMWASLFLCVALLLIPIAP